VRMAVLLIAASIPGAALAGGPGLSAPPEALTGTGWQARFEYDNSPLLLGRLALAGALGQTAQSARLLGDYQFDTFRLGSSGGLRLTSGVLLSWSRAGLAQPGSDTSSAAPYVGVGYASQGQRGAWGFSADLGVAAQNPGAALQFGRVFTGGMSVDDALREMRVQPMIRLGVNYSF
jgi:hypothetical protein